MIGVGIIGLGTVGTGAYKILDEHGLLIKQKTGIDIRVVKCADIDPDRPRDIVLKEGLLTNNAFEVIEDKDVDIVVELMGGIEPARSLIRHAIEQGKWVVTANKALLAEKGDEIFKLAARKGTEIGFEASVCGGIPVIKAIRDGLVGNRITYILGILNGTCNYILTKMTLEGMSFNRALEDAQRLGFAESDPTLDIEGIDAAHKLCILVRLAFQYPAVMSDITTGGISRIDPIDIEFAREFGYRIKLLAVAKEDRGKIEARVEPAMIPVGHPMSSVDGVYNAAYVVGDRTGPTLYYGKGAGGDATGSAVVSDIVDMAYRIRNGAPAAKIPSTAGKVKMRGAGKSSVPYYMRFTAKDSPGVLSKISGVLADYKISISSVIQKGRKENGYVPIVMLTHEAVELNLKEAKAAIDQLPIIKDESVYIRIEEGNQ
ncbi:homoserine dehydrogenase [Syntrophorhabdus aromaticivorans]|uniref:Homoserine dehydrogenase n=1 Tax=Syntrophorhabdus aromaticivorans TaxID=328301 RepID=A0A971M5Q2_9BACT|nr:homoserine dehydrogenase [Syntrophorhabdus aromaticivorans]NLW36523.1 homoserine dehydrogenase [Syntrophorhabdus aromaticivorans]